MRRDLVRGRFAVEHGAEHAADAVRQEAVEAELAVAAGRDDAGCAESRQMMTHGRLALFEQIAQRTDVQLVGTSDRTMVEL